MSVHQQYAPVLRGSHQQVIHQQSYSDAHVQQQSDHQQSLEGSSPSVPLGPSTSPCSLWTFQFVITGQFTWTFDEYVQHLLYPGSVQAVAAGMTYTQQGKPLIEGCLKMDTPTTFFEMKNTFGPARWSKTFTIPRLFFLDRLTAPWYNRRVLHEK